MTEVTYGARTLEEAVRRYHADALQRARLGWVPVTEDRHADPAWLVVEYDHRPAAAAEVVSVLEALVQPRPDQHRLFRFGRRLRPSDGQSAR